MAAKQVFDSNIHLQDSDPTFRPWPLDEYEGLIASDATGQARGLEPLFFIRGIWDVAGDRIGYVQLEIDAPTPGRCWLPMFVLRSDAQSMGYGTESWESVLSQLRELPDLLDIGLNVYAENAKALRFWFGRGFREILDISIEEHLERNYTCVTMRRPIDT